MKLQLEQSPEQNLFTAYGDGFVQIKAERLEGSVIVSGTSIEAWAPDSFTSLASSHFERVVEIKPELVVIGTGRAFKFPSPAVLRPLIDARIGYEVMDTPAACRTYNILLGEGRNVIAALIVN